MLVINSPPNFHFSTKGRISLFYAEVCKKGGVSMADQVNVKANPIQRNKLDVAMELTVLHVGRFAVDKGDIEKLFAKYHALAEYCEVNDLTELISEEVKSAIRDSNYNF
jgi:hypothetical protein